MWKFVVVAAAVSMTCVAAWAGELPCSLSEADYANLANSVSKATPDSVKKMSSDDRQSLCDTRAYIDLVRKKKGDITLDDVSNHFYLSRFLTKEETDAIKGAAARTLAGAVEPFAKKCLRDSTAPECALFLHDAAANSATSRK